MTDIAEKQTVEPAPPANLDVEKIEHDLRLLAGSLAVQEPALNTEQYSVLTNGQNVDKLAEAAALGNLALIVGAEKIIGYKVYDCVHKKWDGRQEVEVGRYMKISYAMANEAGEPVLAEYKVGDGFEASGLAEDSKTFFGAQAIARREHMLEIGSGTSTIEYEPFETPSIFLC